jgi:hypothetical protein
MRYSWVAILVVVTNCLKTLASSIVQSVCQRNKSQQDCCKKKKKRVVNLCVGWLTKALIDCTSLRKKKRKKGVRTTYVVGLLLVYLSTGPETYTADKGMFVEQTHMATTLSFISHDNDYNKR